jgi:hypothetical protein
MEDVVGFLDLVGAVRGNGVGLGGWEVGEDVTVVS